MTQRSESQSAATHPILAGRTPLQRRCVRTGLQPQRRSPPSATGARVPTSDSRPRRPPPPTATATGAAETRRPRRPRRRRRRRASRSRAEAARRRRRAGGRSRARRCSPCAHARPHTRPPPPIPPRRAPLESAADSTPSKAVRHRAPQRGRQA